jgi:hypothetical protein
MNAIVVQISIEISNPTWGYAGGSNPDEESQLIADERKFRSPRREARGHSGRALPCPPGFEFGLSARIATPGGSDSRDRFRVEISGRVVPRSSNCQLTRPRLRYRRDVCIGSWLRENSEIEFANGNFVSTSIILKNNSAGDGSRDKILEKTILRTFCARTFSRSLGQERRFDPVPATSGLPLTSDAPPHRTN